LLPVNTPITTTVYDAQATNLNGGNADEGITYRIKGANADKFATVNISNGCFIGEPALIQSMRSYRKSSVRVYQKVIMWSVVYNLHYFLKR
jgi:hypothetical protein